VIVISIPGRPTLHLQPLVLDVSGTLALDGNLSSGVAERLASLRRDLTVNLLTADTHGGQEEVDRSLNLKATILPPTMPAVTQQALKGAYVSQLGASTVVAIGNGSNDALMLSKAALGIAVVGPEGLAVQALTAADVVCASINDALDLLLFPDRLRATLRI
jgi:soluble P-type ATPase